MARQTRAQQRAEKARAAEEKKRRNARRRMLVGVGGTVAAVALLALFVISVWPAPDEGSTSADDWDLPTLEGDGRVALADFRGKPTIAAFYASWCEVCEEEIPELLALSGEIGDRVNFVAINSQDNGRGLADAEKWGIAGAWPIARDIGNGNGSELSTGTFGMRGMPLNLIYDAAGNLVHVQPGGLSVDNALALLEDLTDFQG